MRILLINNFHYMRGGDCRYTFELSRLLIEKGHNVAHFSMNHPKNEPYIYDKYFISNIDYDELYKHRTLKNLNRVIKTSFWNKEAQKKLDELINLFKPDLAHLQNILHHLTPSIIPLLRKRGIPLIGHLHDYNLICPNIYLYHDEMICERCFKSRFYHCIINRCKKGSLAASTFAAAQRYFHELLKIHQGISYYVVPSKFALNKFKEAGFFARDCLTYIPHFVDSNQIKPNWSFNNTNGVIFTGRLIPEKGLWTLINAAAKLPNIPVTIVGDGLLLNELKLSVKKRKLFNVSLVGWEDQPHIFKRLKHARCIVMPSEWYETSGISVIESAAVGRAAIVSDNTAMTEIVCHEKTGLVFPMGDSESLTESIKKICLNINFTEKMGRESRKRVEKVYSREIHYRKIKNLYSSIL